MRELISPFKEYLLDFYEYKKSCGFKYEKDSNIVLFDRYYANLNINELKLTRDIVEPYLYLRPNERITTQMHRATLIRQFGKYLFLNDIATDIYIVPPISLKGEAEYIPYIFTSEQYNKMINYIDNYPKPNIKGGFNQLPNTINAISTVLKILMSTGMRIGEVFDLTLKNVDLDNNIFIIEKAKNNNQRIIPFSKTLGEAIKRYVSNTPFYIDPNSYLFQTSPNNRINKAMLHTYFYKALKAANIEHKKGIGPRIHDFRHTFAVMSLTQLQKSENNVNLSLSYLSTYLGHKTIRETQKYIWMTPILFKDIKDKMADYSSFIYDIFQEEKFDEE